MKWLQRIHQQSRLLMAEMVDTVRQALTLDQQMINGAELMSLEDRILYSAAPMTVDVAQLYVEQEQTQAAAGGESEFVAKGDGSTIRDQTDMFSLLDQVSCLIDQDELDAVGDSASRIELVFLDQGVADYESILEDLNQQKHAGVTIQVVMLGADSDGLVTINRFLACSTKQIDAVHFITHGTDRALKLGDTWYDLNALKMRQTEVAQWSNSLTDDADLLFYGCSIASSDLGREILSNLAVWTGADVAASSNNVGAESLGGTGCSNTIWAKCLLR